MFNQIKKFGLSLVAVLAFATVGCTLQPADETDTCDDCGVAGTGGTDQGGTGGTAGNGGTDQGGNGGTGGTDVIPEPTEFVRGPFKSDFAYNLNFNAKYINNSTCSALWGNLPSISWYDANKTLAEQKYTKLQDADITTGKLNGWHGTVWANLPDGCYRVTYGDRACEGQTDAQGNTVYQVANMASYGDMIASLNILPSDRAFMQCEQYNDLTHSCQEVSDPGCAIQFCSEAGEIRPNGNMEGFAADAANIDLCKGAPVAQ